MAYCTVADLSGRFGEAELIQLTASGQGPGAGVDSAVAALAIHDATAEIDGYLARRYTLPLTAPGANLVRIACDIARYRLYEDAAPDTVRQRYEQAIRYLERVAGGGLDLGLPEESQSPAGGTPEAVFTADTPVFGRNAL
jgi:phage gp36-like protein